MYRHDKRRGRKGKILLTAVVLCVTGLVIAAVIWIINDDSSMVVKQPGAVTRQVDDGRGQTVFEEPLFRITLPDDWELVRKAASPLTYYFSSTQENEDAKTLVIYIDSDATVYSVNRVLPVVAKNGGLITRDMSDTCADFVNYDQSDEQAGQVIGKWQGVEFVCDIAHKNRNAIGISSEGSRHSVVLNGPQGGSHSYFLIYTDHNVRPDLNLADRIISSIEAK